MSKRIMGVDLPSTLERSSEQAQRTYAKTLSSAEQQYGVGERASRTAFSALKHSFEKVDDHWEAKRRKGPSDPRAKTGAGDRHRDEAESFGGLDVEGHTRLELYERAKQLQIAGRSTMSKLELARAIARKQR